MREDKPPTLGEHGSFPSPSKGRGLRALDLRGPREIDAAVQITPAVERPEQFLGAKGEGVTAPRGYLTQGISATLPASSAWRAQGPRGHAFRC